MTVNPYPHGMSTGQIAVRNGIAPGTVHVLARRARLARAAGKDHPGLLPEPDPVLSAAAGRPRYTYPAIVVWEQNRPGPGARTDLPGLPARLARKVESIYDARFARAARMNWTTFLFWLGDGVDVAADDWPATFAAIKRHVKAYRAQQRQDAS